MAAVFVHGNPETAAIWGPLVAVLGRDDVVLLSPPGFGAPLPGGFGATFIEYRDWLEGELEKIDGPIDLVGHDWGGGHVVNAVMHRPELVRSWASDVLGLFDPDYVWHDLAQVWQTPGAGEEFVDGMVGADLPSRTESMEALGIPADVAATIAEHQNADMGRAILALYRSATQPAMAEAGRGWRGPPRDPACRCWPPRMRSSVPTTTAGGRPTAPAHAPRCSTDSGTGGWSRIRTGARTRSIGSGPPSTRAAFYPKN